VDLVKRKPHLVAAFGVWGRGPSPEAPSTEYRIPYDPRQEVLYRRGDPSCIYHAVRWPIGRGRSRHGEFPLVVAREHFRSLGYTVLASEPNLPNDEGFILLAYPGKRRAGDPAYRRMESIFGARKLGNLNVIADQVKRWTTGNPGGGDPDLFVYRKGPSAKRFFVEVKHHDQLTTKQRATFPLIEKLCPVIVARLVPAEAVADDRRRERGVRKALA